MRMCFSTYTVWGKMKMVTRCSFQIKSIPMKKSVFNYSQVFKSGGKVAIDISTHPIQKPLKPTV
jgi:hypothetical protein